MFKHTRLGLPLEATEEILREFFSACGSVRKITLPKDKSTGQPRGIAFVTFENASGFLQGMAKDRDLLLDKEIKVYQDILNLLFIYRPCIT